mmetsp:Transcript_95840/g.228271  ORF Transcript_95840/g.228271 Transcript_95840/m.228271 type:complete len:808 (-) Transcript_95840:110-2533(-)
MDLLASLVSGVAGAAYELFGYNRSNFKYDRRQRTVMEYQLVEMRLKQVDLWRRDVRDAVQLIPKKMEVYLLVIAIELTGATTCLCKGRIPPGAPPWMVAAGVLAICSCISYLFLALWFGLHAFVAAQAYKVRILTQLVRLPIPSWTHMEAARTYGSDFESMNTSQMLRVPIITGSQESWARGEEPAVDPWGLERSAEGTPELKPDVNHAVEGQRHVWLIREAAKYFTTYDAFCRVSMSAGTSSLATFFCFYCLAYVCTELAAPVAAWAGMFVFCGITLMLLRTDQILSARNYFLGSIFLFFSPVFCAVVTFMSSKRWGNPGNVEYLVPVGLFLKGCWFLYYLHVFHCKEHQTGAVLPRSFRAVLYVDVYGWAKHTSQWWQRWRHGQPGRHSMGASTKNKLPATLMAGARKPLRPEDAKHEVSAVLAGPLVANPADLASEDDEDEEHAPAAGMRPTTFAPKDDDQDPDTDEEEHHESMGDRAGLQPWRAFFFNTVLLSVMWWCASFVAFMDVYNDVPEFTKAHYGLKPGEVARMAGLIGEKVTTDWGNHSWQPHGFACGGGAFAVAGRSDGRRAVLTGRLDQGAIHFAAAPECAALEPDALIQDLAIHCKNGTCDALVMPLRGQHLVSCPLAEKNWSSSAASPLSRAWLEDRGGIPLDEHRGLSHLFHPEEMSAMSMAPCPGEASEDCLVVGTTARRLVQMARGSSLGVTLDTWLPRRLLQRDGHELPGPGSFAVLGNRFLGVLQRESNSVRLLDLGAGGRLHSIWNLPLIKGDDGPSFSGICAAENGLFALQAGPTPAVWRFAVPKH